MVREHLRAFADLEIITADYERAAQLYNISRSKRVQGSNTDFLICTVTERNKMSVLTTDNDFRLFAQNIPINLHQPRSFLESH